MSVPWGGRYELDHDVERAHGGLVDRGGGVVDDVVCAVGAHTLGAARARGRGDLAAGRLLGAAVARYVLAIGPLATVPLDDIAAALSPSIRIQLDRPH
ncbi:hypothetical protein OG823_01610 [Kitasatospora sp. NBC_00315]